VSARGWRRCLACFVMAALLGAAGCGEDEDAASSAASGKKRVKVSLIIPSQNNEAFKENVDASKAAAEKDGAIDFKVYSGTVDTDVTQQIANLRAALTQQPDAVIVLTSDTKAMSKPLINAAKTGAKIVVMESKIENFEPDATVLFPDLNGGKVAGGFIAETAKDGASVGFVSCFPGQFESIENRIRGAKSAWTGKNFEIAATVDGQCDNAKGRAATADLLTAHPDVDVIYSVSDSSAVGALSATKQAGKDPLLVSYDGQSTVVQKIADGEIDATVDINITKGSQAAVRLAAAAARGEQHEKVVEVPAQLVTKENAAQVLSRRGGGN
jgi:ribose transport system substrate-binding protein